MCCAERPVHLPISDHKIEAGGKPSTWLPPGGLVEHHYAKFIVYLVILFKKKTNFRFFGLQVFPELIAYVGGLFSSLWRGVRRRLDQFRNKWKRYYVFGLTDFP